MKQQIISIPEQANCPTGPKKDVTVEEALDEVINCGELTYVPVLARIVKELVLKVKP